MDKQHNCICRGRSVFQIPSPVDAASDAGLNDPAVELPLAQLKVCSLLYGGPLSMSAWAELGVSLSAMTQIADRLERARLVKRVNQGRTAACAFCS